MIMLSIMAMAVLIVAVIHDRQRIADRHYRDVERQ
jgi:hypothetical protein